MAAARFILWSLVVLLFVSLGSYFYYSAGKSSDMAKIMILRNAMLLTVAGNIETEGGYTSGPSSASELAEELVRRFRAADYMSPEDKEELGPVGRFIEPIEYVLGEPTGPFQISVEPDDEEEVVIIRSWGRDLNTPIEEKRVGFSAYGAYLMEE